MCQHPPAPQENPAGNFFSGKAETQSDCDSYARKVFGAPLGPVSPQGRYSYTVMAAGGKTVVQFRENTSLPNLKFSTLIYNTHPGLVAIPTFKGTLGTDTSTALQIYCMAALPGANYFNMADTISETPQMQMAYAESLAKFFTQAWSNPMQEGEFLERTKVEADIENRLGELLHTLPDKFHPLVDRVLANLGRLTAASYRFVLTHGDFSEFNILVDTASGAITGVVDWPEACVLPFGFALHALEYVLGGLYLTGWAYNENASSVREHFWTTFKKSVQPTEGEMEAIKLARLAGILFRYGTRVGSHYGSGMSGIRGLDDTSLLFLKAYTQDEAI